MAYDDVLDAWNYYLEDDNHGPGVVLRAESPRTNAGMSGATSHSNSRPFSSARRAFLETAYEGASPHEEH
jgi:hypothetical protein